MSSLDMYSMFKRWTRLESKKVDDRKRQILVVHAYATI